MDAEAPIWRKYPGVPTNGLDDRGALGEGWSWSRSKHTCIPLVFFSLSTSRALQMTQEVQSRQLASFHNEVSGLSGDFSSRPPSHILDVRVWRVHTFNAIDGLSIERWSDGIRILGGEKGSEGVNNICHRRVRLFTATATASWFCVGTLGWVGGWAL